MASPRTRLAALTAKCHPNLRSEARNSVAGCRTEAPRPTFQAPRSIIGDCRRVADVLSGKSTGGKNAHELFSANSMSAYRILGPGGAERQRALSFKPASSLLSIIVEALRGRLRKLFSCGCRRQPLSSTPARWAGRGSAHDVGLDHDVWRSARKA